MKKCILLSSLLVLTLYGWTQGCSPIRNTTTINPGISFNNTQSASKCLLNITNRYFDASSSYRGSNFVSDTLVSNKINTFYISVFRIMNKGWSLALVVPLSANSRTNSADHGGLKTPKHTTRAFGLSDIRFTAYKWLLDPALTKKWNIQIGLGVKLPTGDYTYEDYFFRNDSTKVLAPVDPAIQPGDGGTGITCELNTFYAISKTIDAFFNAYYLMNPREQNGVSNLKGRNATPVEIRNNTTVMSVPDQYNCRIGASLKFQKLVVSAAVRYEKLTSTDLIGGNAGFRRVASVASVEPGLTYNLKRSFVFVFVGMPFQRNIVQNHQNNMTPAGFADYLFSFGAQLEL